jgi:hypothetical protein
MTQNGLYQVFVAPWQDLAQETEVCVHDARVPRRKEAGPTP